MSLPGWRESGRGLQTTESEDEDEEEAERGAERFKKTPIQNLEKRLRMLNRSQNQTPPTNFIRPSPVVSEVDAPFVHHLNSLSKQQQHHQQTRKDSKQQLSTILSQRDLIHQKDLEMSQCLTEIKLITNYLTTMSEVFAEIESHITSVGGIDNKVLLKLLHPLKNNSIKLENTSPSSSSSPLPLQQPHRESRELLIINSKIQKFSSDIQSLLQVFTQCLCDSSRTYQEQLAHARERSNLGTRNALQAEKAAYHSSLLLLREQHTKELRDIAEQNMKSVLESESRIRALTLEFDELRGHSQLVNELKREAQSVEERIQKAIERTRDEERNRSELKIQEVREQCQLLLKDAEETIQNRQRNMDDYNQEKLDLQKQHHDQMIQFLQVEREKLEKQNGELMKELQLQRDHFASEKERLLQETATQRQRVEHEADELRAEHLQTVSSLKAEMSTKMRQLKVEEKQHVEEALMLFRREKEQLETEHAAEIDRMIQQHKSNISRIKAQLEVKHEDEMKSMKRRHDNEVNRFSSEIDRMRRLIARKGVAIINEDDDNDNEQGNANEDSVKDRRNTTTNRTSQSSNGHTSGGSSPHSRATLSDKKSVNFQNPLSQDESRGAKASQRNESPVIRISDADRSFSFTPTKSLDWTMLNKSMKLQEDQLSRNSGKSNPRSRSEALKASPNSPSPKSSPGRSQKTLSHNPSPKGIGKYLKENTKIDQSFEAPPPPPPLPPPPDTFPLEVAWETSKIPGHNVSANASKVETYMSKLQRYLEGDQTSGLSDYYSSSHDHDIVGGGGAEDEDEDIIFPAMRNDSSYASEPDQDSLETD